MSLYMLQKPKRRFAAEHDCDVHNFLIDFDLQPDGPNDDDDIHIKFYLT
jgi:hypothetical protein